MSTKKGVKDSLYERITKFMQNFELDRVNEYAEEKKEKTALPISPNIAADLAYYENMLLKLFRGFGRGQTVEPTLLKRTVSKFMMYSKLIREERAKIDNRKASNQSLTVEQEATNDFVETVREQFLSVDENNEGAIDMEKFIKAMSGNYPNVDEKQLKILFMKIDANCDGGLDLSEYLTYILFEHQEKLAMEEMDTVQPYPRQPIRFWHKTQSLDYMVGFTFVPVVASYAIEGEVSSTNGKYVAVTKQGFIYKWRRNFQFVHQYRITGKPSLKSKKNNIWVTAVTACPDLGSISLASNDQDIQFYSINSTKPSLICRIIQMPASVTCLHYYFERGNYSRSRLVAGDTLGNVFVIYARDSSMRMFDHSDFNQFNANNSTNSYIFLSIMSNKYPSISCKMFSSVHADWVQSVKWVHNLSMVGSCTNVDVGSVVFSDLDNQLKYCFNVKMGVHSFAYYKEGNLVITGGADGTVRTFNPYVPKKVSNVLSVHRVSIVDLQIPEEKHMFLTLDKLHNIFVWDISHLRVVQRIMVPTNSSQIIKLPSILYVNPINLKLVTGHTILSVFTHRSELDIRLDQKATSSPINAILISPIFDIVVVSNNNSVISIWDIKVGEKLMQISNAHPTRNVSSDDEVVEITALSFDSSGRKLISGARDGSVAVWNFNNGANIDRAVIDSGKEITCIKCSHDRICFAGWNRRVVVYYSHQSDFSRLQEWRQLHKEDILDLDIWNKKSLVATASYDGEIILWILQTGSPYIRFSCKEWWTPFHITVQTPRRGSSTQVEGVSLQKGSSKKRNFETSTTSFSTSHDMSIDPDNSSIYSGEKSLDYALNSVIFMKTRPIATNSPSMISAGAKGWVKFWSIHVVGGLIAQFNAAHRPDESIHVLRLAKNEGLLITGDSLGYVKIWLIVNYCVSTNEDEVEKKARTKFEESMLMKFQQFTINPSTPKIKQDLEVARIKALGRPTADLPRKKHLVNYPTRLLSFRSNINYAIADIQYIEDRELICVALTSGICRLFNLTGRYVGSFGQTKIWGPLPIPVDAIKLPKIIPDDIRRHASATTLVTLRGSRNPRWRLIKNTLITWASPFVKLYEEGKKTISADDYAEQDDISNITTVTSLDIQEDWLPIVQKIIKKHASAYKDELLGRTTDSMQKDEAKKKLTFQDRHGRHHQNQYNDFHNDTDLLVEARKAKQRELTKKLNRPGITNTEIDQILLKHYEEESSPEELLAWYKNYTQMKIPDWNTFRTRHLKALHKKEGPENVEYSSFVSRAFDERGLPRFISQHPLRAKRNLILSKKIPNAKNTISPYFYIPLTKPNEIPKFDIPFHLRKNIESELAEKAKVQESRGSEYIDHIYIKKKKRSNNGTDLFPISYLTVMEKVNNESRFRLLPVSDIYVKPKVMDQRSRQILQQRTPKVDFISNYQFPKTTTDVYGQSYVKLNDDFTIKKEVRKNGYLHKYRTDPYFRKRIILMSNQHLERNHSTKLNRRKLPPIKKSLSVNFDSKTKSIADQFTSFPYNECQNYNYFRQLKPIQSDRYVSRQYKSSKY
ncbi:hypothetical protein SNEBB_002481 [Seison nebaliae]|nr:hypothetical protein SNEBB_002481 [Seison nebaliae]